MNDIKIVDFDKVHMEQAMAIALQNYKQERKCVPELPVINAVPDLAYYAGNGMGVAAFDGDNMVGFLCSVPPFENAFGIAGVTGVFSPMGVNGAIGSNRAKTYARMYQAAAEKWVQAGATSHAICLYAHDEEINGQFYRYGFGIRCVDAVRDMKDITLPSYDGYMLTELAADDMPEACALDNLLHKHMLESPCFMVKPDVSVSEFMKNVEGYHFYGARKDGELIAFLCVGDAGETFLSDTPGYIHANGAYCLPEHRGKGIQQGLLSLAVQTLKSEVYTHLGVDFESINPAAYGFWLKYFSAYTYSAVRRIDEDAVYHIRNENHP